MFRHAGVAAATLVLAAAAHAQETRGQILGRVADQSGAVIAGATVRAVNTETNVETKGASNATGDYTLPYLIPGVYSISAERDGFKKFLREGITVQIDDKITVDVTLEVGSAAETITVTAEEPLVEAADASLGQVVDERRVTELPLKDGNPMMLADLSPGVMNLTGSGFERPFDVGGPSSITVNGVRTGRNEFTMDGAPNTGGAGGNVAYAPPAGTVSEFKIQTATFDAANGFAMGAVVNVSLKSGTNKIHGQAYTFLQNPVLNANSFFSNMAGLPKDDYRQNRWGINANGPVVLPRVFNGRNRTFWMYGYEGIRDSLPRRGSNIVTVPTAAQRQGDLSGLLALGSRYQIYDPATITPAGSGRFSRQPLAENVIPRSRISPVATAIMERYWPAANLPGAADGTDNYTEPLLEKNRFFSHVFRVDHNLSDRNRFFVRGNANKRYNIAQQRFHGAAGNFVWRENRGFAIDDVYVLTPRFLINTRYTYTRYWETRHPASIGLDITTLGFAKNYAAEIISVDARGMMLPNIDVDNYAELNPERNRKSANDIHSLAANFTWMVRSHTLRFGGEYRVYRDTAYDLGRSAGRLQFSTGWTRGPMDNSTAAPLGQDLAAFLLGLPTGGNVDVNGSYAQQYQVSGWYVQNAWKVSRRLTLNFGLRYELEAPTTERYNRSIRGFDTASTNPIEAAARVNYARAPIPELPVEAFRARGGVTFAGVGNEPRQLWTSNKNNFAPRVSAAYQLGQRSVIRGGYGMFFDIARQDVNQTGFNRQTTLTPSLDNGQNFIATLANPFPDGFIRPAGASLGLMTAVGQSVSAFKPLLASPYMERWQFSVQRRMANQALLEIAYVGSAANRMRTTRQLDPVPRDLLSTLPYRDQPVVDLLSAAVTNPFYPLLPSTGLSGRTVARSQLLRPYPHFTGIASTTNEGSSSYHSMQTRLEKRFSRGYTVTAAWTWAKFMEATSFLNETDARPERVISDQDRSHRLVVSSIMELPFGRRRRWGASARGLVGALIGGWQAQGIYQAQSGGPLGFSNIIFNGKLSDIPLPPGERTAQRWFNTGAGFERDSRRSLSYNIRTFPSRLSGVRSQGLNRWDLSATKNTYFGERSYVQFRCEFSNAFNHTHFTAPNTSPTNAAFGTITGVQQMPRSIQFGLRVIF